eukprot:scaffold121605_cov27-Phaeocystis_antarctica.AAC.1
MVVVARATAAAGWATTALAQSVGSPGSHWGRSSWCQRRTGRSHPDCPPKSRFDPGSNAATAARVASWATTAAATAMAAAATAMAAA